jgi:collagen type VII alpha
MVRLSQGATGCVEIQIYDKDLQRADLSKFGVIQILVTDVGNNVVAIFSQPELIGNYFDAPLEIQTDGVLKGCFTAEMTSNAMTGRLMAEIKMIEDAPTGASPDVVIIKCIEIGSIKESQFSLGFTSDGVTIGGGGGGGTLLGVTSGTSGSSGYNGTSGTSGFGTDGTSGSSGTSGSGTSGSDGSSGTSGENGTSGTSGINGTSGTSGVGTDGTSGTSGDFGTSGTSGISGSSGTSGSGVDGAVTLRWILENTSGAIPSGSSYFSACCNSGLLNTGSFKFAYNSSTISSEGFWVTITGAIANGLTPYLQIVQVSNRNIIGLYEITGVTYSGAVGSGQYNVTANGIPAIYGNGIWSVGEEYAVSFSLSGATGSSGTSGLAGTSGSSGTSGAAGSSGTSGAGFVWRGAWEPIPTVYVGGQDVVSYTGGSYIKIGDGNSGSAPPFDSIRWSPIAETGSAGDNGSSGTSGIDGTSGTSGTTGTSGSTGSSGTSGSTGSSGTSGVGTDGTSGTSGSSGTSGISGAAGSSGTSGIGTSGTSGSAGTSGTSGYVDNDWLYFKPTATTIPATGNNYALAGTTSSNGSVSYDPATGYITLAANKTYKLEASFALANNASNNEAQYQWINVTASNTAIGNVGGAIVVNSSAQAAWQPLAEAIIVTTGTTQVALRSTFSNSTGEFNSGQCFMMATQINGWSGSSGSSGTTGTSGTSGIGSSGTSGTSFASPYSGNLNVTSGQAWVSADANGNTTANTTVDWNTGNVQTFTLNAATTTFTFSNGQAGATYILIIRQNAAGSQTIVWPGTVTWTSTPTMTATANRYDIYTFIFDGSKYFGSYVQNYV